MTTPPALLQTLRAAQARSANEQRILSGRDWLLVAAFVQSLAVLEPIHARFMLSRFDVGAGHAAVLEQVIAAMLALIAALLLLWWWARYAPFRAAVAALAVYIVVHGSVAMLHPHDAFAGLSSKVLMLLGLILAVRTGWLRRRPQ